MNFFYRSPIRSIHRIRNPSLDIRRHRYSKRAQEDTIEVLAFPRYENSIFSSFDE